MMVMVILGIPVAVRAMRIRTRIHLVVVVGLTAGMDMLFAGFHHQPRPGHKTTEQAHEEAGKKASIDQHGHAEHEEWIGGSVKGPFGVA